MTTVSLDRDRLEASAREWLTGGTASTGVMSPDEPVLEDEWGSERSDVGDWLADVDRLIHAASDAQAMAPWFSGVLFWIVADTDGAVDGFLITVESEGGRRASHFCDIRDSWSDESLTGVDAAVDVLIQVWLVVAELRACGQWTVIGFYDDGEPVVTGVVEGSHFVKGGVDDPQPWATSVGAGSAAEAERLAISEMDANNGPAGGLAASG